MMKKHITTTGDTWDYLSYKYYGDETLMGALIEANPKYVNVDILPAGIELTIPDIENKKRKAIKTIW